jgi:putative transposase
MTSYRRNKEPRAVYFFTVTLNDRRSKLLTQNIQQLKESIFTVKERFPFHIIAMVVLPDHLHAIWRLPYGETNYSIRWREIKSAFSRKIPKTENSNKSRQRKNERGIWQRRFWVHTISNEEDLRRHIDYIHYNPVKHGYVKCVSDWPYSTFHAYVKKGIYAHNWGAG